MSASPPLSPLKTPEDPKRKRSPTPPVLVPMTDGIEEKGFRLRVGLLASPKYGMLEDSSRELRDDMAEHLVDQVAPKISNEKTDFAATVQIVNTLFEVAATLSALFVTEDPDQRTKLDALNQHALEGLDLIGGAEAPDIREEEGVLYRMN